MIVLTSNLFIERNVESLNWVIGVLVFVLLLSVISRVLFTSNYFALKNVEIFTEVNDNQLLFSITNQIMFALLIGTLAAPYLTQDFDFVFLHPISKAIMVGVLMILFFWVKYFFTVLGNFAFKSNQDLTTLIRVSSFYRSYSVVVMWIAVVLFYFTSIPKIPILVLCLLSLILLRAFQLRYRFKLQPDQNSRDWYYNILYLCALEILPLLVLGKFLTIW